MEPEIYFILFLITNFTNKPISFGSPILPVGKLFSIFFMSLTNSLIRLVLNGPGAMFIVLIFFFELLIETDLSKLLMAGLKDEEIINSSPGSLIIDDDI